MFYPYEYSSVSGCHSYKFTTIPIVLNLSPAEYTIIDIDADLNLYTIDIINKEERKYYKAGPTISKILYEFIHANKNCALGYYPSNADEQDMARVNLFNQWMTHVDSSSIVTIKNIATFNDKEELIIQVFMHSDYPQQDKLLVTMNGLSRMIEDK